MKIKALLLLLVTISHFSLLAQKTISGTVVSESNEPISGVVVIQSGSDSHTHTDSKGNFLIGTKYDIVQTVFCCCGYVGKNFEYYVSYANMLLVIAS